jgi:hypothetical protein
MGPADTDTDTDVFSQPIFLPIPYISTNISATDTDTDIIILADIWPITGILADILADIHVFQPI